MENQQEIQELSFIEQNLQNLMLQKQSFQMELSETQSAIKEIEKSGEDVYKIIGQLMIKKEKDSVKNELSEKEKILDLRVKTIEKQELKLSEKADELREKISKNMKK